MPQIDGPKQERIPLAGPVVCLVHPMAYIRGQVSSRGQFRCPFNQRECIQRCRPSAPETKEGNTNACHPAGFTMRPWFNVRKAAQMAAFFAKQEGGTINVLKLVKLVYLANRAAMEKYDFPLV